MNRKIDWYSCTFKRWNEWKPTHLERLAEAVSDLRAVTGDNVIDELLEFAWDEMPGRAPFSTSLGADDGGVRIFGGESQPYWLLEVSGRGCDTLRTMEQLGNVIESTSERVTRLDIAVDMPDGPTPDQFIATGYTARIKAHSRMQSKTGTTHYVGSPKSDRFARVYSYDEPHPRAGVTRVEMVLRKKYARAALEKFSWSDVDGLAGALGASFAWKHPHWKQSTCEAVPLSVPSPDRRTGGTERWLVQQAAPAFRRLVEEKVITDPEEWLRIWFLGNVDSDHSDEVES